MRNLKLAAQSGSCDILVGESIGNLMEYCEGGKAVIITDANVRRLHGDKFPEVPVIEIGLGEGSKTLETVQQVYGKLLEMELERSSFIVGIGGGIVCDVAGFAASTYLRGTRLGFVPTTLIAQADAAVGGKNGVNLEGYKNLVGTIRQPKFVLIDFELLKTLPRSELACGFAEVIKHAAIADAKLFDYIEGNIGPALSLKKAVIEKIIHDSLLVKTGIVAADEAERGARMRLNFGHTVGHALEKCMKLPHGEAVAVGMVAAAKISVQKCGLPEKEAERLGALLSAAGLPTSIPKGAVSAEELADAVHKDKKRQGGAIRMCLLEGMGKPAICEVKISELEGVLHDMC